MRAGLNSSKLPLGTYIFLFKLLTSLETKGSFMPEPLGTFLIQTTRAPNNTLKYFVPNISLSGSTEDTVSLPTQERHYSFLKLKMTHTNYLSKAQKSETLSAGSIESTRGKHKFLL